MIRFLRVLTKYLTVAKSRYFVPLLPMKDTHQYTYLRSSSINNYDGQFEDVLFLVESEFFVLPRSLLTRDYGRHNEKQRGLPVNIFVR